MAPGVDRLSALGLMERVGGHVRATAQGTMVLNGVVGEFIG
jgi:hypothetical protein